MSIENLVQHFGAVEDPRCRGLLGAQSDDPAWHANVSAHHLKASESRRSTSVIRFVHQSPSIW